MTTSLSCDIWCIPVGNKGLKLNCFWFDKSHFETILGSVNCLAGKGATWIKSTTSVFGSILFNSVVSLVKIFQAGLHLKWVFLKEKNEVVVVVVVAAVFLFFIFLAGSHFKRASVFQGKWKTKNQIMVFKILSQKALDIQAVSNRNSPVPSCCGVFRPFEVNSSRAAPIELPLRQIRFRTAASSVEFYSATFRDFVSACK